MKKPPKGRLFDKSNQFQLGDASKNIGTVCGKPM
jgi:hypothetical protein